MHLLRRTFALLAIACTATGHAATAAKPNVIFILADDHGYGDVSTYGPSDVRTPHLDRFAAEGMLFTRMRANCTVCSPTRAAFLTGRYADRAGVPGVIRTEPQNSWGYLAAGLPTVADRLRTVGYHTAIVGKWHLGLTSPNLPNERGFDFFHGFLGDMMDSYTTHLREGQTSCAATARSSTPPATPPISSPPGPSTTSTSAPADEKPFFLYLATTLRTSLSSRPAEWLARVRERAPALDDKRAKNVALVEHLDDAIGRVLTALRDTGLDRNTLVILSSDNGG